MGKLLIIGAGGFIGAVLRYQIGGIVQAAVKTVGFPVGTLAVNTIGCFAIGFLTYFVEYRGSLSPEMRSLVLIGFLGAFTTFSTFGLETFNLIGSAEYTRAGMNVIANSGLGLVAVWLGRVLASLLGR